MGKLTTFIIVLTGVALLFHLGGIVSQSQMPSLIGLLLNPENLQNTSLNLKILLAIEGVAAGGIIVLGFLTKNTELVAATPIAIFLLNLLLDFIAVYMVLAAENRVVANLLMSPVFILLFVTIFDWWRGRDN